MQRARQLQEKQDALQAARLKTELTKAAETPKPFDARSLERYYGAVHGATTTLKRLGYEGDLQSCENLRRLLSKLPADMRKAWAEHSLGLVRPTLLEFDQWLRLQLRIQLSCEAAAPAPSQQKRTAGMFLTTKTASTSDANDVPPLLVDPARFSSWNKYRRVVTWIYRFINNAREPDKKTRGSLTAQELLQSEHRIIRQDQKAVKLAPQPASDIVWFKDGRRLPAAASRPALQLTGGNRSVAGMYQCHVTDDLATTQVRIGALPARLLLSLVQQTVQPVVDTAITFTCAATSSPPPAVTWTRDGVSADQLGGRFHVQDSTSGVKDVTSQLTIQQVSRFSRCHS
ncbi:Down syndrome cell adhesion molecule-like protein Dscam2 [Amphibalanus amphitrite]|uniref:Down syndrome cell adhesion molecule-like protein Dscam2 n=1 Tax=Amphibalanus amphitrite TaxID=1232801 RepID=A0A6A4XAH4_AMPAM|nr:Down syndrome cell adhesion molecule-like protein Dscam2 [Amphibalanus amphitrite]